MKYFPWVGAALAAFLVGASSAPAAFIVLQPGPADGKDAQIYVGAPNTNLGNEPDLTVNYSVAHEPDRPDFQNFGLIQFDLSPVTTPFVVSAKLDVYHLYNDSFGMTFDLFRNTTPWDEQTVTWNTQPQIDPTAVASLLIDDHSHDTYREWDVTGVVNGWLSGAYANNGLTLARTGVGVWNPWAYFESSDQTAANAFMRPKLKLELPDFVPPPDPPPASSPAPSGIILAFMGLITVLIWRHTHLRGAKSQTALAPPLPAN
jgi:hypothetical protein